MVRVGPPAVVISPTPRVSAPATPTSKTVDSLSAPQSSPYLTTGALTVSSTKSGSTISSSASVANVLLGPSGSVISSPSMSSTCTTNPQVLSASSTLAEGTLVNGVAVAGSPPPNTSISFAGGSVLLNGQFIATNPDGTQVIDVRAATVRFDGNGGNDLIIGESVCTQVALPSAPTSPSASAGNTQAVVSWTAPEFPGGSAITGYTITPFIDGAAQPAQTFDSATTQTVTGLTNGTTYTFRVAATNDVGTGPQSATSGAITPAGPPEAPIIGSATAGNGEATVSWTGPSNNGGSPLTGYMVTPYIGSQAQPARRFDSIATEQSITGLTNGTTYTFRVAANNAVGTGPQSLDSNAVKPK